MNSRNIPIIVISLNLLRSKYRYFHEKFRSEIKHAIYKKTVSLIFIISPLRGSVVVVTLICQDNYSTSWLLMFNLPIIWINLKPEGLKLL
jgi:hypothetical protein